MKKLSLFFFLLVLCAATLFAQAPEKFSYQSVVRNASNQLVANAPVGVRVSILQGGVNGTLVYMETHTAVTNANGLLTLEIGGGSVQQGVFADIDWANGLYFLKTETDPNGGSDYSVTSTQQLLSVPYALYSKEAGNGFSGDYNDLTNTPQLFSGDYNDLVNPPTIPTVPTNVSAFANDAGYITMDSIPSNVSAFNNDAGYITEADIPEIPSVPEDVSFFNNDANYVSNAECADLDLCSLAALVSDLQGQLTELQDQLAELQSTIDSLTVPDTTVTPVDTTTVVIDEKSCPGAPTVTDHEGNVYATVLIGDQCWMRDNLRTTTSPSTGTYIIPAADANYTSTGKQARWYDNDSAMYAPMNYGLLYNWNAAVDTFNTAYGETSVNPEYDNMESVIFTGNRRGICPAGWHLPSDAEWTQLTDYVGSQSEYTCGGNTYFIAKALASETGWLNNSGYFDEPCYVGYDPSTNNASGFSVVPAGCWVGGFFAAFDYTSFWSSTESGSGNAWSRYLLYSDANVYRGSSHRDGGYSVRCLRDVGGTDTTQATLPTVTTGAVSSITETTAICGGNVTSDGGAIVTARGVCWSTSQNPTVSDSFTADGSGTGNFTSNLTGLTAGTTYYMRAYATNSEGTAYGSQVTFTTHLDSTQLYHNFIGTTYYDLQSNGSVSNKIVAHSDGTVSAVWTTSGITTSSRGTGYNYFDGTNWINVASSTDRIENERTGWGSITCVGDAEIMAAHNSTTGLVIGVCPQKGANNWIFTTLQGPVVSNGSGTSTCLFWPALASSGNIIHLIACTESGTGYLYQGIQACLLYYRGTFDTLTNTISWEEPRIVGDVTSAEMKSFSGDAYAIAAKGNTVAIVNASKQSDVFLWKSSDNGVNFAKTTIFQHPYPGYDESTTLVLDTPYVADGSCAVALSENGTAHVAFGITRIRNETPGYGSSYYYPGVAAMLYWNETQQPILNTDVTTLEPNNIANAGYTVFLRSDLNNDGGANWSAGVGMFPPYHIGSVSTPQIVVDGNNVYVVYTAILDWPFLDVSNSEYYRGVFARKSTDGGATFGDVSWLSYNRDCFYVESWDWAQDTDYIISDIRDYIYNEGENVFPAVAPEVVNGKIVMTWQQDYNAGSYISEYSDPVVPYESNIFFLSIDANEIGVYNNTNEISQGLWNDGTGISNRVISGMQMQPDSESESVNNTFSSEESSNADSSVVNSMDGLDRQHPKCEK